MRKYPENQHSRHLLRVPHMPGVVHRFTQVKLCMPFEGGDHLDPCTESEFQGTGHLAGAPKRAGMILLSGNGTQDSYEKTSSLLRLQAEGRTDLGRRFCQCWTREDRKTMNLWKTRVAVGEEDEQVYAGLSTGGGKWQNTAVDPGRLEVCWQALWSAFTQRPGVLYVHPGQTGCWLLLPVLPGHLHL